MSILYMKEDCDFLIRNKSIAKTEDSNIEDIKNRILLRIQSNALDWDLTDNRYSSIGFANLSLFAGSAIKQNIINSIKENIFLALVEEDLVDAERIFIRELPIDREIIVLYVSLIVENDSQEFNLGLSVMYDTRQNVTNVKIEKISEEPWQ